LLHLFDDVLVVVDRKGGVGMSEHLRYDDDGYAFETQQHRTCVPEIMKTCACWESDTDGVSLEGSPERIGIERPTVAVVAHQVEVMPLRPSAQALLSLRAPVSTEPVHQRWRQPDRPSPSFSLGFLEVVAILSLDTLTFRKDMQRAHDASSARLKVDVSPAQSEDLGTSHPSHRREPEGYVPPCVV
jgi:hypothetical protein